LRRFWNVGLADVPRGNYGWGFVKLEPLFEPPGERFLVLDSDTILTGPVLDLTTDCEAPFLVDDEEPAEQRAKEIYYDWEQLKTIDPIARVPEFLFNSGQWFGTAGVLTRNDFSPWLEWTMPRKVSPPGYFMNGEQGILNYIFNRKVALGTLQVQRRPIMRWPGHSLGGLNAHSVANRTAVPSVVHWAGMKRTRQRDMVGADLLAFFEKQYYKRIPAGEPRRLVAGVQHTVASSLHEVGVTVRLTSRRVAAAIGTPRGKDLTHLAPGSQS